MLIRIFHLIISIIFLLCAAYIPEIQAHPVANNNLPKICGQSEYKGAGLDELATDLGKLARVNRIQKSIDIRIPEQKVFGDTLDALSHKGKQFIAQMAGDLSCYPDSLIYIKENSGSSTASKYQAETKAFRIQTALRRDGIDINRLDIDIATTPELHQRENSRDKKGTPADYFELRIIPRV
jgi:hypothetical protein